MTRDDNSEWKQQQDEHEIAELAQMVASDIAWLVREDLHQEEGCRQKYQQLS